MTASVTAEIHLGVEHPLGERCATVLQFKARLSA
jgi:hypothetical protein